MKLYNIVWLMISHSDRVQVKLKQIESRKLCIRVDVD